MEEQILILTAGGTAAAAVYLATRSVRLPLGPAPARALHDYLAVLEPHTVPVQSLRRDRVILAALGLPPHEHLLMTFTLGAGVIPALLLLLLGLPLIPAAGAGALVSMLVHAWLVGRWRKFQVALERDLPTFVSRLAATLLVTGSPLQALEEVTATLADASPLRRWMERLVVGIHTQGHSHLADAQVEAASLSPSLALVVFELSRFFETGGSGFTRAFATTAEELAAILEARAVAGAKAEGARGAVHTMLAIMGVILLLMLSSPVQRAGFAHPTAQLVTAASLAAMAYGYFFLNGMIDEALEG